MPIRMSNGIESQAPPAEIPKQKERRQIMWELSEAKYDLSDLILDKSTASQLLDVISYFQNRTLLFETWGLGQRFPQQLCLAVNLYGPPGTGKTMGAHAIAKAISMPLICVDYAEIESKYVGEISKNLSDLFRTAQEKQAVIFFDEADALLSKRIILDFRTDGLQLPPHIQDFTGLKLRVPGKGCKPLRMPYSYQDTAALVIGASSQQLQESAPYLREAAVFLLNCDGCGDLKGHRISTSLLDSYDPAILGQLEKGRENTSVVLEAWRRMSHPRRAQMIISSCSIYRTVVLCFYGIQEQQCGVLLQVSCGLVSKIST